MLAELEVRVTFPPGQNAMGPDAVTVGTVPDVASVTDTGADVALTPFVFVTFTVYDPAFVTVIDCVVAPPGVHRYAEPELAVNTTLPPVQKESGPLVEIVADA